MTRSIRKLYVAGTLKIRQVLSITQKPILSIALDVEETQT